MVFLPVWHRPQSGKFSPAGGALHQQVETSAIAPFNVLPAKAPTVASYTPRSRKYRTSLMPASSPRACRSQGNKGLRFHQWYSMKTEGNTRAMEHVGNDFIVCSPPGKIEQLPCSTRVSEGSGGWFVEVLRTGRGEMNGVEQTMGREGNSWQS